MNEFKLTEHRQEFVANFTSESVYVQEGINNVSYSATLLNLNYEQNSGYTFSLYLFKEEVYRLYKKGELTRNQACIASIDQGASLEKMLKNSNYKFPSYVDLPFEIEMKNIKYDKGALYAVEFSISNHKNDSTATAVTFIKGV